MPPEPVFLCRSSVIVRVDESPKPPDGVFAGPVGRIPPVGVSEIPTVRLSTIASVCCCGGGAFMACVPQDPPDGSDPCWGCCEFGLITSVAPCPPTFGCMSAVRTAGPPIISVLLPAANSLKFFCEAPQYLQN